METGIGRDIYFAPGRYQPETPKGQRLLAHELTHTVQQSEGATPRRGEPGDVFKQATTRSKSVAASQPASPEGEADSKLPNAAGASGTAQQARPGAQPRWGRATANAWPRIPGKTWNCASATTSATSACIPIRGPLRCRNRSRPTHSPPVADIYFAPGRYRPDTREGKRLLAHELTHTVQQRPTASPSAPTDELAVSSPQDPHEVEAERVSDEVAAEKPLGQGAQQPNVRNSITPAPLP